MRRRYGVNTIVLATDSVAAARACASGILGFECRTLRMARAKFDSAKFIESRVRSHEAGALSGSTVALDALADIDMLADCSYHVLVFRSAISRLAYTLALARHGRPPPVISLQWPYSPAHLKRRKKALALGKVLSAKRASHTTQII